MGGLPLPLLLLADGRLPAGGHVHSGGAEQAIDAGRITDLATLAAWSVERTVTLGAMEATLAAAAAIAAMAGPDWSMLVAEAEARSPVPALREAARARGRALVRVAEAAFDRFELPPDARDPGWPLPIATGAVVSGLGSAPVDAAVLILHGGAAEPAQAAVRRLGLDPVGVTRLLAQLAPTIAATADRAVVAAAGRPATWPAPATPHFDLAAAAHAARDDRYFAT
jgi:urease accessory protein